MKKKKQYPEYNKEWRRRNPDRNKSHLLKYLYGISIEDYNKMAECQSYKCFLCGEDAKLFVDHNHKTNEVRQLLCDLCNRGLGYFKENADVLERAAVYVREHG